MADQISLAAVYGRAYGREDARPYPYQLALAQEPAVEVLIAPTGLGKTAAVTLGWAWRRLTRPEDTPRRLVWCLPMRTLVEQTAEAADGWMQALAPDFAQARQTPPTVHRLMGGEVEDDWRLRPQDPAILVGTQDMLLSRALMRGYGMGRFGWPIDYGLLHTDALWVFDEVQLMGAGLATSAQLEAFRCIWPAPKQGDRQARSLWVSATLQPDWLNTVDFAKAVPSPRVMRWDDDGAPEPEALTRRLDAVKTVRRAETRLLPEHAKKDPDVYARALAGEVLAAHRAGCTTLVILNQVRRAQAVYQALQKLGREQAGLLLVHSRFRQSERDAITAALMQDRDKDRIVVATQAVEAGVDITSAVLFTELAPWASLVQRFGRCNRTGELNAAGGALIFWIDLDLTGEPALAQPYEAESLERARVLLEALDDAAPRRLPPANDKPQAAQVIRRKDFEELFDIDPDLSGYDLDVSPFIRDADDRAVRLFWREVQGGADTLHAPPPRREELCAAPLGKALEAWLRKERDAPVFIEDPTGEGEESWVRLGRNRLRPGMVLLLDRRMGGYDPSLGFAVTARDPVEPVPAPAKPAGLATDTQSGQTAEADPLSRGYPAPVGLTEHLKQVVACAQELAEGVGEKAETAAALARAAAWHDVGKAYGPFQALLGNAGGGPLLAKSGGGSRAGEARPESLRRYFRHELASALAFLQQHDGEPDADLVAFLIAAHHGKVRMGVRAWPDEKADPPDRRLAKGVQDGDELPPVDCGEEVSQPQVLSLAPMQMGEDEEGRPSWAARTQGLLKAYGPFRLAYLEALLRMADWRASGAEKKKRHG